MRKIEKLDLRKIVDPSDILKKKQMMNLWGGREKSCYWCCTTDSSGTCGQDGYCCNANECWMFAESACGSNYGIFIKC